MSLKSKIEREVDAIRLDIYEETKDMTTAQLNDYYRKSGEAAAKKYGFKIVQSADANPRSGFAANRRAE
ncbi:MAG: hypothetical protein LBS62_07345 [Clostridiales bacterium]|jgi:hypothetical protein|nr:hypothetical protein [Clostridiales bacterium]